MKKIILVVIIISIFISAVPLALAQDNTSLKIDIDTALDPNTFFDKLFNFFKSQPVIQESSDIVAGPEFDEANEKIGEKIGVNPVDIIKAFVRIIIWALEATLAFFSNLVN